MQERYIHIKQIERPLVKVDPQKLTSLLRENGYPNLDLTLINTIPRGRGGMLADNREEEGQIVIFPGRIAQDTSQEVIDTVKKELHGIQPPRQIIPAILDPYYAHLGYKSLYKEFPEADRALHVVASDRVEKYLAAASKGFEGYTIVDKKTKQPVELTEDQAIERAERFIAKLMGYNLERATGSIMAHEYGHSSDEAKEALKKFDSSIVQQILNKGGLALMFASIAPFVFLYPIVGTAGFIMGFSSFYYGQVRKGRAQERQAFAATTKEAIVGFTQTVSADAEAIYNRFFQRK